MPRSFLDVAGQELLKIEYSTEHAAEVGDRSSYRYRYEAPTNTEVLSVQGRREWLSLLEQLPRLRCLDISYADFTHIPNRPGLILAWDDYQRHKRFLSPENVIGIRFNAGAYSVPDEVWQLPNLTALDLSLGSMKLPAANKLSRLSALHLAGWKLTEVPEQLRSLDKLSVLDLSSNKLTALPEWISNCSSLRILNLAGNPLGTVPETLTQLRNLRALTLSNNGLVDLPDSLADLSELSVLWLASNNIRRVPTSIAKLRSLVMLSLHRNQLEDLPPEISQLQALRALSLASNPFEKIPEVVFSLRRLLALDVSAASYEKVRGRLKEIPAEIGQLDELETVETAGQPIEHPPPEVVDKGVDAIRAYYRQLDAEGLEYLCEAKLLIVGEPGAGKTSLAKKIRNPTHELARAEPTTEGIEVTSWAFPTGLHVREDGRERVVPRDLGVNIWDFGGQEIYHATHQFFLTRRSVYVLVADSRKEDTDFHYWLSVIELLGDASPVVIVKNERDDRRRDIDETRLMARFGNVRGTLATNLATNRGLDDVVKQIRAELERLPHIGTPLPATWRRVREALEVDPRDHITLEEYLGLCKKHGFAKREDGLQLSSFLHDLGICLHFQEDPLLRKTVILKTRWGTDAVYRLLDHKQVLDRHGRFDRTDLPMIWHEADYASMHEELVQLMMKFELCYPIASGGFIAPQLLEAKQPEYGWDARDNIVVKYVYDFMPKGILTRFIVATHHLIEDQNHVWSKGVVLARTSELGDVVRGEVVEDYLHRQIVVRLSGTGRRELLAIIDHELDRIHRSFPRLKYDRLVPCNCKVCSTTPQPHFYRYEALRRFAADQQFIQCQFSYDMLDAAHLLAEVFPSRRNMSEEPTDAAGRVGPPEGPMSSPRKEVYLSYAWGGESEQIANELADAFAARGIRLVRDRNEVRYKDSIRNFMKNLGRGKAIVIVASKKYFQSKSCMFELTAVADAGDVLKRVFPVVLDDARIDDPVTCISYLKHWETEKKRLSEAMKTVDGDNLQGIREEMDLFAKVRTTLARLLEVLGDMNSLTSQRQRADGFKDLLESVAAKLAE